MLADPLTGSMVTSTTRLNVGTETSCGLKVVGASPLVAWWKANVTASTFRRTIRGSVGGTDINTVSQVYTARLSNSFIRSKKLNAQLALNYRSPVNSAQGTRSANFNIDLAATRSVLADRGTSTLRVADIFNTLRFGYTDAGADFATVSRCKRELRIALLGFSYRFGQNQDGRAKRKNELDDGGGFDETAKPVSALLAVRRA